MDYFRQRKMTPKGESKKKKVIKEEIQVRFWSFPEL